MIKAEKAYVCVLDAEPMREYRGTRTEPGRRRTDRGDCTADEVVLAAGAWTPELVTGVGLRVPVEAAKGYSITVERPEGHPDLPLALVEGMVFVTPMGSRLRFGGTLELAGLDMRVNQRRVDALALQARRRRREADLGTFGRLCVGDPYARP